MGLFSGKTKSPDISKQEAEAARQRAAEDARAAEQLRIQQEIWKQQREDDERRYQEQLKLQQAEIQRQYAAQQDMIARQEAAQKQQEAARQAERDAEAAGVRQRADQARSYASGRQALMDSAVSGVDAAYSGFDDTYFQKFAQDFVTAYKPAIDRDFRDQSDNTTYSYADAGTLRSSAAADSFGDLERGRTQKEGDLAATAQDKAQGFRDDIDRQKSDTLSAIFSAGAAASPVLSDGGIDVQSSLGGLSSQIGALTTTAKNRAQNVSRPSLTSAAFDPTIASNARRPGARTPAYGAF